MNQVVRAEITVSIQPTHMRAATIRALDPRKPSTIPGRKTLQQDH